jgi:DNA invertase Pin-like site-specific DNA recombinase
MADARLRKFDVVLVWKLDRFSRSLQHLIENIQTLNQLGIRFYAPTQNIDNDNRSPMGTSLIGSSGERGLIVERVKAGAAEAKRKGKHCGRPRKVCRRDEALALRKSGMSWRAIAKQLGVPQSTIRLAREGVP